MKKLLLIICLMATTWNIMATGIGKETSTMTTGNKSNCTYIDKPDILLERVINKVKKERTGLPVFLKLNTGYGLCQKDKRVLDASVVGQFPILTVSA